MPNPVDQHPYNIIKTAEEDKFSLGVAYAANEIDCHGDFCTVAELEKTAWGYLPRGGKVGLMHKWGAEGAGEVVESYIYRFPPIQIGSQTIEPGDWLLGVVWDDPAWDAIRKGRITGYSIHGLAYKKTAEALPVRASNSERQIVEMLKAAGLSTKKWDGSASNYDTTEAYCSACLIDTNPDGAPKTVALCKLPIKEPSGAVNLNAVHAAAAALAGGRGGVKASAAQKAAAARKLKAIYTRAGETPPESLVKLIGE